MQRLRAEKDEIRGTGQFQGGEHWFRGDYERRQAGTGRDGPDELSARHARGGQYPGSTAADERVADGQRGVLAGRDDDQDGDAEERGKIDHHHVTIRWIDRQVQRERRPDPDDRGRLPGPQERAGGTARAPSVAGRGSRGRALPGRPERELRLP